MFYVKVHWSGYDGDAGALTSNLAKASQPNPLLAIVPANPGKKLTGSELEDKAQQYFRIQQSHEESPSFWLNLMDREIPKEQRMTVYLRVQELIEKVHKWGKHNPSSKYSPAARAFISRFMKKEAKGKKLTPKQRGKLLAIAMSKVRKKGLKVPAKNARSTRYIKVVKKYQMPSRLKRRIGGPGSHRRHLRKRLGHNPGAFSKIYTRLISIITDKGTFRPRITTSIWGDKRSKNRMILKGERWTPKMEGARVKTIEATGNTTAGVNPRQHYYHPFTTRPKLVRTSTGGVAILGARPLWTPKESV